MGETNKWFAYSTNKENTDTNLICFPYAGGAPSYFIPWRGVVPVNVQLFPVQYQMRGTRLNEKLPDSIQLLATEFVDVNFALLKSNCVLLGHCTGGVIAFEVARTAKEQYGIELKALVLSSAPTPTQVFMGKSMAQMSDNEFLDFLVKMGFINGELAKNKDFVGYYLPILKADFHLHEIYKPISSVILNCPVHVCYGNEDKFINEGIVKDWKNYTTGGCTITEFEGNHFYIDNCKEEILDMIK